MRGHIGRLQGRSPQYFAAVTCNGFWPAPGLSRRGPARKQPRPVARAGASYPSRSFWSGMIPGTSQSFHISSILLWKYSMSSSMKCANLPCLSK